jgi:hypothetical protein
MITNIFALADVWEWFDKYHKNRASISMSNVVVNPAYLDIGMMPPDLKSIALDKISTIPAIAIWPEGSYHAEEFEYQTGIESIRDGLLRELTIDETERDKNWKWFLQYTRDLDRMRGHNTFKYITEIQDYVK